MKLQLDTTQQIDEALEKIFVLRDALNEIIVGLRDKRENIVSQSIQKDVEPDAMTPERFMAFDKWGEINQNTYRKLTHWFENRYSEKGLWLGGTGSHHKQVILETKLNQNKPFEEQYQAFMEFWPYIRPVVESEILVHGEKREVLFLKIFEYTLSEYACYYMLASADRKRIWVQNHYGDEKFAVEDGDVRKVLEFIYKQYPYQRKKTKRVKENYDDDDYE